MRWNGKFITRWAWLISKIMAGPGGASTSKIKLEAGTSIVPSTIKPEVSKPLDPKELKKQAAELEKKRLESLMKNLREAIDRSQALKPFKDQLLIDITPAGLRIQIVDKENRPMFDIGSTTLKPYTVEILHELGKFIDTVPNRISISGHTDVTRYASANGYSNWELSAERANAARRSLIDGGLNENKVAVVVGLSSTVLFDKQHPQAPINRRISIIVMNHDAEAAVTGQETPAAEGVLPGLPEGAVSSAPAAATTPVAANETANAPPVATAPPSATPVATVH